MRSFVRTLVVAIQFRKHDRVRFSVILPGSERFYHNKNQIFFNKSCCYGPLLDPDKVSQLPEATPPGKVSSVIRTGLEMVAKAAFDPEKVIDLMQEGCGVRVVVKHKGKILKKVRTGRPVDRPDADGQTEQPDAHRQTGRWTDG